MPRVLIADQLSPAAVAIFQERGIETEVRVGLGKEELEKIIAGYDGLAVRSATKVTEKIVAAASNLRVVGRAGIGVDNIDVKAATAKGIIVMNTPFGNSITTAEHALSLMMALARPMPIAQPRPASGKNPSSWAWNCLPRRWASSAAAISARSSPIARWDCA
jgi:D-3-phosphoglycerate dehydrogenase